ncbi:MAG: nitronate monooxygenase family protein [Alphaproteobacteria bacterium]
MSLPQILSSSLSLPAVAAPMFLISGPDLVVECCRAGIVGSFPSLNGRTNTEFDAWLSEIETHLAEARRASPAARIAPFAVNLISHRTNPRLEDDLDTVVRHRVPIVITSKGSPAPVLAKVHGYGGLVFHDVINIEHARKAAAAGVDGLILVCAGAGGHAGLMNPFAILPQVRDFFPGTIILAGCINDGRAVRAAEVMGADLAYIGTRFMATTESLGPASLKQMLVDAEAADIIYTQAISGVAASFLRQSLIASGLDPATLPKEGIAPPPKGADTARKAWKDVWSAGQGVGGIKDVPGTAALIARLKAEYRAARDADRSMAAE